MTSAIGVERSRERRFLFQCPCGANIVTTKKTVTCANCGKAMEVHRARTRRQRRNPEPLLWPLLCSTPFATHRQWNRHKTPSYHQLFHSMATRHPTWHPPESPDYNERCLRLGFLILLAPLWVPLLWILLSPMFVPLTPEQDRPYHYERHDIQLIDGRGRFHTIPVWRRVDD
jgi:hypothetical protein